MYKYFRSVLKQWERDLLGREDSEKRTAKAKLETRTQKQCKDYIRSVLSSLFASLLLKESLLYYKNFLITL